MLSETPFLLLSRNLAKPLEKNRRTGSLQTLVFGKERRLLNNGRKIIFVFPNES